MCFGGSKKSQAVEKAAIEKEEMEAAEERVAAEDAQRKEQEKRAVKKREDISEALEKRTADAGKRGGSGRRSLFRIAGLGRRAIAGGSAGYLGRFDR
jgi:hypothetical protein